MLTGAVRLACSVGLAVGLAGVVASAAVPGRAAPATRCASFRGTSFDNIGHARSTLYVTVAAKGVSGAAARTLLLQVGRHRVSGTKKVTVGSYTCLLTVRRTASSGTCFNTGSHPGLSPRQVTWVAVLLG